MALFDKCYYFNTSDAPKDKGLSTYFCPIQESEEPLLKPAAKIGRGNSQSEFIIPQPFNH